MLMLMVPRKIQQRDPIMMPECMLGRVKEVGAAIKKRRDVAQGLRAEIGCRLASRLRENLCFLLGSN